MPHIAPSSPLLRAGLALGLALLGVLLVTGLLRERRILGAHQTPVASLAAAPVSSLVASGAGDVTSNLWDIRASERRRTLRGHGHGPGDRRHDADGR